VRRRTCSRATIAPDKAAARPTSRPSSKGVLKIMSKMGVISTVASYHRRPDLRGHRASTTFVIDEYLTGTASRLRGVGFDATWPRRSPGPARNRAFPVTGARPHRRLETGRPPTTSGVDGEAAPVEPRDGHQAPACRRRCRLEDAGSYAEFARLMNDHGECPTALRGLWDLVPGGAPVPLDEVEPAAEIVKRFATGAMSFGSISKEAHENAGHRHEPHRRPLQHRRGRRGPGPVPGRDANGDSRSAPSSRWPRAGSASPPST
jgi:glutamate synthase (NADPH/NADH) large chain